MSHPRKLERVREILNILFEVGASGVLTFDLQSISHFKITAIDDEHRCVSLALLQKQNLRDRNIQGPSKK